MPMPLIVTDLPTFPMQGGMEVSKKGTVGRHKRAIYRRSSITLLVALAMSRFHTRQFRPETTL